MNLKTAIWTTPYRPELHASGTVSLPCMDIRGSQEKAIHNIEPLIQGTVSFDLDFKMQFSK